MVCFPSPYLICVQNMIDCSCMEAVTAVLPNLIVTVPICAVSLGTSLAFLSFFTALARSFDVITDPLMGWISDSTKSQFGIEGRRRPYMRVYALLILITTC